MTVTKELTIFNFYWLKLALLHVQIAVKMLLLGEIWLIGTQESTDQMILQRHRIANMTSFIQGNCDPEYYHSNRGSYGLATNGKKKNSENILNTILFT